ncbi:hypothetical protein HELRODRAFT_113249 [Helobdella robusta]|uniref:U1 small nuclear ribonucleoprotein 70 kDa n=1 Tax=Helobdella robusta TaxID=6412 RepID=T1EFQ9_HELRO|nr:hypothetical protein HELRODRAFT_113249 [Helobdella robusta]ESO00351.1 hypothetical protein HELRODRAFT_113249 [Helobdella robusta]
MTQFLPPNLLALFAARDPIPYLPPVDKLPHEKESKPYIGVADFVRQFENPKETPPPTRVETREEKKERKRKERAEQTAYKLEQDLALWDPSNDNKIYGDPFKTLFVARVNFDTSESKLRREFDQYGPIKKIHMITSTKNNKPRGYAFVEYEHERDMHAAYKHADGKKIDGRRVLVDVERGRTVKGWRPRRLGGGLGNTRKGGPEVNTKYSGRDDFDARDRVLPDDRERTMRESSRDRRRSRSRDRDRRRSRDRKKRSRERKRSADRDIKKEITDDVNGASARKRSRRSRSRDRRRSRSKDRRRPKRSRSRDKVKKEKIKSQVKEEMNDGEYGGDYGNGSGYVKRENDQDYYEGYNQQLPPLPPSNSNQQFGNAEY